MNIIVTILAIIGGFCVASFLGVVLLWAYTVIGDWWDKKQNAKDYIVYSRPSTDWEKGKYDSCTAKVIRQMREIDDAMDTGRDTQVY